VLHRTQHEGEEVSPMIDSLNRRAPSSGAINKESQSPSPGRVSAVSAFRTLEMPKSNTFTVISEESSG